MSDYIEIECMGSTVTIEMTDDGDVTLHGWDEEVDLAAQALGMDASPCSIIAEALEEDKLEERLFEASERGDAELVKALLFVGAQVDAKNNDGRTPLHWAASNGHPDVVELLLKAGARVGAKDDYGRTPLHYAASNGHPDVVELLLKSGAKIDAKDDDSWTPLHLAAQEGHAYVVELLLDAGAKVDAEDIPYVLRGTQCHHGLWTPLSVGFPRDQRTLSTSHLSSACLQLAL